MGASRNGRNATTFLVVTINVSERNSTMELHRKLQAKAKRASGAVKDPTLRHIAYHSILRHLYELPRKRKTKIVHR